VVFGLGTKLVPRVHAVEINVAHAKLDREMNNATRCCIALLATRLIPVVMATWPSRLNHPVIHEARGARLGLESIAAQKYGPPEVGLHDL
jgi:hypothetical protein